MGQLEIFENRNLGKLRVLEKDGEVWFVGKDLAEVLGYTNSRKAIKDHVDFEDIRILKSNEAVTFDVPNRGLTLINESGLYALIFASELPSARAFKRWVTKEVLPSIRKRGYYIDRSALKLELTEELLSGYDELHKDKAKLLKQDLLQSLKDQIKVLRAENKKLRRVLQASEERAADLEGKVNDIQCSLLEQVINLQERGDDK